MPISKRTLFILVGLFCLQLLIRAHNITAVPVFIDEYSHIRRASVIYDFERHPAVESHGKFLFYFLPSIFNLKDVTSALHLARTSVALTSLITSALIFLIARYFLDERAGLVGVAFYCLVPFVFFFERTTLADPTAGLVATACAWMAIRFALKPNRATAIWLGVFMAMTLAAKLTMAFVIAMPAATILILGNIHSWDDLWERYGRLSILTNVTVFVVWMPVLIPAWIARQFYGIDYLLYDDHLIGVSAAPLTLSEKLAELQEKMVLLVSTPIAILLIVQVIVATVILTRRASIILVWLGLAWFPIFFIVASGSFQSRYLMSGFPAVAVLFGMGSVITLDQLLKQHKRYVLPIISCVLLIWGFAFVLPFARTASSEPEKLNLPAQDEKDYLGGWYNAYGLEEAVFYLENRIEPQAGKTYTILATRYCLPPLYDFKNVDYICARHLIPEDKGTEKWQDLIIVPLEAGVPTYLVTDYEENLEDYMHYDEVEWELLTSYVKPHSGRRISVWRLTLPTN